MAHTHLLQQILSAPNVKSYLKEIDTRSQVLAFGLNVILALEGARLAYRSLITNPEVRNYLLTTALRLAPSLRMIPFGEEPLLILKSNYIRVLDTFVTEADGHVAMGKVLGYAYTGTDWVTRGITDHYVFSYQVGSVNLYSFNVPLLKYTPAIKKVIVDNLSSYNDILEKYGYPVTLQCALVPRDDQPLVMILP
jgi:hypothetical protein